MGNPGMAVAMAHQPLVLIVDDEEAIRNLCRDIAQDSGMAAHTAATTEEALDVLSYGEIDVLVTDIRIPQIGGVELIRRVRATQPEVGIVVLTGHGTIEMAVEAMQSGVIDYITKPFSVGSFEQKLKNVARVAECNRERRLLRGRLSTGLAANLVGRSPKMQHVQSQVLTVSGHDCPVLILGETGTGKEVLAHTIHSCSPRAAYPFVIVDCGALSPTLIESELFGHERGAFTGAIQPKKGLFEAAENGSLFLDEVGELPKDLQCRLLRVIQEREVRRVGSTKPIEMRARIIAATNRNLADGVRAGTFREDLFYRLNVASICLPPLRERMSDLPLLVSAFIEKLSGQFRQIDIISPGVWPKLTSHDWPGNVRELQNVIARALAFGSGPVLREDDVLLIGDGAELSSGNSSLNTSSLGTIQRKMILRVLAEVNGNKTHAAARLGISLTTLHRKLKHYEPYEMSIASR
jgi:DNA-binding NtrC family response regulator